MILALVPLVILVLLRFWGLDLRPVHHDEAVNGWFVDGLYARGYYQYDPANYHGPLYFYVVALFGKIFGRNISALRVPPVLFGAALTFVPFVFRRWIGFRAAWISTAVLVVSPAMVFFSRYSIHETAFALSCVLFLRVWLVAREPGATKGTWILLGVMLGLMATLKENFTVFGAALFMAEAVMAVQNRGLPRKMDRVFFRGIGIAVAVASLLVVVFFTGFFQDRDGVMKFFSAFLKWSETGSKGNGHEKPFLYWITLLAQLEWPALLGLFAGFVIPFLKSGFARINAWTGTFLWLIYSLVSYKTPWCVLSFLVFLVINFGISADAILSALAPKKKNSSPFKRNVFAGFLISGSIFLGYQAFEVSWLNPDQDGHPYIYGQTYRDFTGPVDRILSSIRATPGGLEKTRVQVISSFTWPLPYLLGEVRQTGYYGESNVPSVLDADYLLIDENLLPKFESRITGDYARETVRARQWASRMVFFTRKLPPEPVGGNVPGSKSP
jgi:uncharacterized protein (TIGR03663 family)